MQVGAPYVSHLQKGNSSDANAIMLKNVLRISGYLLLIVAFLIIFFATVIFAAYRTGVGNRNAEATAEFSRETARQIELAQANIAEGNLDFAAERLEWLAVRIPDDASYLELQLEVTKLSVTPDVTRELPTPQIFSSGGVATNTPTPVPTTEPLVADPPATLRPTRIPPTPRPERIRQELVSVESAIDDERWEDAISELIAFQLDYPDYERFYTDSLLFEAYIGAGFQFTNSNRVTIGINYFEEAEKLGELPEDAISQLYFSRIYLTARAYYGINWPLSISRLSELCSFAPLFQNSCDLLFNARTAYGDQLVAADEHCPAAEQYRLAMTNGGGTDIAQKMNQADWKCKEATPTPWVAPTATPASDG